VRGTITSETWETLNATFLEARSHHRGLSEAARGEFLEWVKYRSLLTRAVIMGTMLRDEAYHFFCIGTFLEHADHTTRLLEARWRDPGRSGERLIAEAAEWSVLLRAMSAFEVYRRVYREAVTPQRVTELLLLKEEMPQSVHRCLSNLRLNLAAVANHQSGETQRRAGELHAQFRFGRFEELCAEGVTAFLDRFQSRLRDLGARIARDFLVPLEAQ
ncbi:MAG: alpha-E domain-containing protein, partial [Steroidobacteraceae bacterium]